MDFLWLALTRAIGWGPEVEEPLVVAVVVEAEPLGHPWHWPLDGTVTSGFGWRDERHHDGVDIAARPGRPVEAAGVGTVVRAEWYYDYGRTVEIVHPNGQMTRYAHLDEFYVELGNEVEAADVIGTVGVTGNVTGPHLHFELIEDGEPVDPIALSILFGPPAEAVAVPVRADIPDPTLLDAFFGYWGS